MQWFFIQNATTKLDLIFFLTNETSSVPISLFLLQAVSTFYSKPRFSSNISSGTFFILQTCVMYIAPFYSLFIHFMDWRGWVDPPQRHLQNFLPWIFYIPWGHLSFYQWRRQITNGVKKWNFFHLSCLCGMSKYFFHYFILDRWIGSNWTPTKDVFQFRFLTFSWKAPSVFGLMHALS